MASLAPSLVQLRKEFNAIFPGRDKASDGWLGDSKHASRPSKHNPGSDGLVEALDLDEDVDGHDDVEGQELWNFVQHLLKLVREKHPALYGPGAHIIYEGRIWSHARGWSERAYTGSNAHRRHVHVAVVDGAGKKSTRTWRVADLKKPAAPTKPKPDRWLGLSNPPMVGHDVRNLHNGLIRLDPTNKFQLGDDYDKNRYGQNTATLVARFQNNRQIIERGFGPQSLARLRQDLAKM